MIKVFTYIQWIILALSIVIFLIISDWTIKLGVIATDIALLTNLFRTYKVVKILGTICCFLIILYLWFINQFSFYSLDIASKILTFKILIYLLINYL